MKGVFNGFYSLKKPFQPICYLRLSLHSHSLLFILLYATNLLFTLRLKKWGGRNNTHPSMLTTVFLRLSTILHFHYTPRPFLHNFHLFTPTFHMQNTIKFHLRQSMGVETRPTHLFFFGRGGGVEIRGGGVQPPQPPRQIRP